MKQYLKKKHTKHTLKNVSKSKTNWTQRISITVKKIQIIWINKHRTTYEEITARLGRKGSSALDDDYDDDDNDDDDDDDDDDDTEHDADAATLLLRQCATSLFLRESETRIVK
jgi:phosphopantothenoylcysteine synthetase/decarboxylase